MSAALVRAFGGLNVSRPSTAARRTQTAIQTAPLAFRSSVRGQSLAVSRQGHAASRGGFQIVAKQNSLKRQRTAERNRQYNKSRKSAVATRSKKVLKILDAMRKAPPSSEEQLAPIEKLISEAYKEIDKAVVKGVMKKNTAARRKSRLAVNKRKVLQIAGLFKAPTMETAASSVTVASTA